MRLRDHKQDVGRGRDGGGFERSRAGVNMTRGRRKNHNRTQTLDRRLLFSPLPIWNTTAPLPLRTEINPYQLSVRRHHHRPPSTPSHRRPPSCSAPLHQPGYVQTTIVALTSLAANGERILSSSRDLLIAPTIRRHELADWFLFRAISRPPLLSRQRYRR